MSILTFDCDYRHSSGFRLKWAFETDSGLTAIQGPSGSGKTTALQVIAGLLRPTEGRVTLHGRVLFDSKQSINVPCHRRRIGFVFQDYQLFPHLDVEGNLRYGMNRVADRRVDFKHLVRELELGSLLNRRVQTLSGGQRQRVAFGRAIASGPSLLLMDEPVSALDVDLKCSVLAYLSRVIQECSIPTILVTHEPLVLDILRPQQTFDLRRHVESSPISARAFATSNLQLSQSGYDVP